MAKETAKEPKAKKKVEGTFADPWKPKNAGEVLEGVYLGAQDALGKRGAFKAYHIRTDAGQRLSVSGASLNTIMAQIPRKTRISITFEGTQETDKGDMKVFSVEVPEGTELLDPFENEDSDD